MKAPTPPNYREGSGAEHCGNCRMYDGNKSIGKCWGYGNSIVRWDGVCDSWVSTDPKEAVRGLWRAHRKALKANG